MLHSWLMAIILISWVVLAIAFCLALLRAAARPLPPLQIEPAAQPIAPPQVFPVFVQPQAFLEILPRRSPAAVPERVHCTTV